MWVAMTRWSREWRKQRYQNDLFYLSKEKPDALTQKFMNSINRPENYREKRDTKDEIKSAIWSGESNWQFGKTLLLLLLLKNILKENLKVIIWCKLDYWIIVIEYTFRFIVLQVWSIFNICTHCIYSIMDIWSEAKFTLLLYVSPTAFHW